MSYRITRRGALAGALAGTSLAVGSRRAWSQAKPIRIGVTQTISGPLAYVGTQHVMGARVAAKLVNDAGGIEGRKVELVVRDTRANANDMVAALRELAGDGINLVFGEAFSTPNLAAWPIVPSLGMIYVPASVVAMELNHDLFNRNCFRASQNAYMEYVGQAQVIADRHIKAKRWGAIVADAAGFRVSQQYFYVGMKRHYAAKGAPLELIDPVIAKVGAGDYRNQINELVGQKLDGIIMAVTGGELITFVKQAKAFGLLNNLQAMCDMTYNTVLGPTLKKDTPQNYWTSCTWTRDAFKHLPLSEAFYKLAVEESKNAIPDPFLAQAQAAMATLIEGVRNAKSLDTETLIKTIETTPFDTVYGKLAFRAEDHQLKVDPGYIRYAPDDSAEGWKIAEYVKIPWAEAIEAPSPGKKFEG